MTIATSRTLLVPYTEQLELDFIKLNCCPINRAEMNGPHSVASAKYLFKKYCKITSASAARSSTTKPANILDMSLFHRKRVSMNLALFWIKNIGIKVLLVRY